MIPTDPMTALAMPATSLVLSLGVVDEGVELVVGVEVEVNALVLAATIAL